MILYYKIKKKYRIHLTIVAIILSVILNCAFHLLNNHFSLPFFLDSTFTVITAALFGLFPGIFVGFLTNLGLEIILGFPGYQLPFAIVNILTAITTYYLVKSGFLKDISGVIFISVILALINAFVGAVVVTIVFGGITNQEVDSIVKAILITGRSIFTSAFLGRILINFADKGIAVIILYPIYKLLLKDSIKQKF